MDNLLSQEDNKEDMVYCYFKFPDARVCTVLVYMYTSISDLAIKLHFLCMVSLH